MKNMWTIALETYKQKVESRVFIIMLLVLVGGTFFGMNYEGIFKSEEPSKENVLVVSKQEQVVSTLQKASADLNVSFLKAGNTLVKAEKKLKKQVVRRS
ncbi:hypothetical protein [Candidatus Enterococcus mansonii]